MANGIDITELPYEEDENQAPSTVKLPSDVFGNPTRRHPPSIGTINQTKGDPEIEVLPTDDREELVLDFSELDEACSDISGQIQATMQEKPGNASGMTIPPPTVQSWNHDSNPPNSKE